MFIRTEMTGYGHGVYADAFREHGTPRLLPRSGGWLLVRQIPGLPFFDAMGCYPLFCCNDWSGLLEDLEEAGRDLISVSMVPDPFGDYDLLYLKKCFPDVCTPYKDASVFDLTQQAKKFISRGRQKKARRALQEIDIHVCRQPENELETLDKLYSSLVARHTITGMRTFSTESLRKQLSVPGTVMLLANDGDTTVGAAVWYLQNDVAYGHLAAFSEAGYQNYASYALDWFALQYFKGKVRWLYFGPGAGVSNDGTDGLSTYKKGWSTEMRSVMFCGRIMNRVGYDEIVSKKESRSTTYFPAYRSGEFG